MQRINVLSLTVLALMAVLLQPAQSANIKQCPATMSAWLSDVTEKLSATYYDYRCMVREHIREKYAKDNLGEQLIEIYDIFYERLSARVAPLTNMASRFLA
ncbi:unnamed protein product [Echinostoma caproni]|uniref:DUF4296 domain-containing protein n=1 Tax=Echinostoma caproni TaxID=27848 RepID=A0A183AJH3_9TREM|nr:unnamed protein product [Echinostoma caproni]